MNPWNCAIIAILLSVIYSGLAVACPRGWWVMMMVGIGSVFGACAFADYIPRVVHGYGFSAALPWIALPLLRFDLTRLTRVGLVFATVAVTVQGGWMEFMAPALAREELAKLDTNIDEHGVCRQTTAYTCGPAAAVTALRRLGFLAQEGDLAMRANSSHRTGTDPSDLARAIVESFGDSGARVEERPLDTIEELRAAGLALTVIKWDANLDHWLVVLEVTDTEVRCADPARGLRTLTLEDFREIWEHETILVWKK